MSRIYWLTAGYIVFIGWMVVTANRGDFVTWFNAVKTVVPFADKIGHCILMGGLALLVNISLMCRCWQVGHHRLLIGSVVIFVVVTLEEFSQLYFEHRTFDWYDLLADYVGIFLSGYAAQWVCTRSVMKNVEKEAVKIK